jgi:hypothetical protein
MLTYRSFSLKVLEVYVFKIGTVVMTKSIQLSQFKSVAEPRAVSVYNIETCL